ncbi:MAG: hypothetical protein ACYDEN_12590 [Acidimicrobiales bacterium]
MTLTSATPPAGDPARAHPAEDLAPPEPAVELFGFLRRIDEEVGGLEPGEEAYALGYGAALLGGPELREILPASALLGWTAPREVDRLVVVASGTASACDDAGRPLTWPAGDAQPAGDPVHLIVVADRRGRLAGRLRVGQSLEEQVPAGGRMVDTLRRCFGLPTLPPPGDPAALLACLWLGVLLATARPRRRHRGRLTWSEALRLHPANELLLREDPDLPVWVLETVVRRTPGVWTWEQLRQAAVTNGSLAELCPPDLARWMDVGMYARWVMAEGAPLEQLLAAARDRVDGGAYQQLTAALAACGLDVSGAEDC